MDGVREYHAKQNKPNPKKQGLNIFSDMWRIIHNKRAGVLGENTITSYEVERSEGRGRDMRVGRTVE